LKTSNVPVAAINIGPVHKKDVMKALKSVTGGDHMFHKEYATILAFDVRVEPAATKFAEENDIKIFTAQIIYHLFDQFTEYTELCNASRKNEQGTKAVFPVVLDVSTFISLLILIVYRWLKELYSTRKLQSLLESMSKRVFSNPVLPWLFPTEIASESER
jgi:hypothetical protein